MRLITGQAEYNNHAKGAILVRNDQGMYEAKCCGAKASTLAGLGEIPCTSGVRNPPTPPVDPFSVRGAA